jgi:hypothetical protein
MKQLRTFLSCLAMLVGLLAIPAAQGQSQGTRAQIEAATANAKVSLRADIASARMTGQYTIGQFLDAIGAPEALDEMAADARQIGGPRWADDQTCQVKLEVPGSEVVYQLIALAGARISVTPIPAAVLEQELAAMKQRTFTATGTSVSPDKLSGIRPIQAGDRWNAVSETARTQAVDDARRDAVQHTLEGIRTILVGPDQTVGDLLARDEVRNQVNKWLSSRPVTEVKFGEDLQVELSVSLPPEELMQAVIESARQVPGAQVPSDEQSLSQLRREFAKRVSSIGRATATAGDAASRPHLLPLPNQPPPWAQQSIDAEAIAPAGAGRLKARTDAEEQAGKSLRAKIGALPITRTMTIDAAAKQDPRIEQAVNRAMLRARISRTDWKQPNGAVLVGLTLDPWVLWSELRQAVGQ